jgi:adhesin transport system membrane fusion protein
MMKFLRSLRTKEYSFMAPKVAALSQVPNKFATITFIVIASLVVFFLIWAGFAKIDVISHGMGRVIPSQKNQIIAHLEGGIIQSVSVKEGDLVEEGQILITIDPTIARARYNAYHENYLRYLAASARLQAQIDEKDYKVPEEVQEGSPLIADEETLHYLERKQRVESQLSASKQLVIEKQQEIEEQKAKIEQAQEQLDLSQQELTMVSPLVAEQLISKREVLRLKRDVANLKGEIATGKATLPKNKAAFEQAKYELNEIKSRFENEDQEQLREIKIKLEETQANLKEAEDRMKRTAIRSPIKGYVKDLKLKTIGGVIRNGEQIMEVVPYEDTLLVEANILPSDVAFIHPGQEANVKITAYDYAIYGSLKAELIDLSEDTIHDPELKKDFYRVIVQTDKNYLVQNGKKLPIIPGMQAEIDIRTGNRTVLEYMVKPIIKGFSQSFRER